MTYLDSPRAKSPSRYNKYFEARDRGIEREHKFVKELRRNEKLSYN